MNEYENELVIPVIAEEVEIGTLPVTTGSVRVTKRVITQDEVLEHELRSGRADVQRFKTDRVVDGPQQVVRDGNKIIIPVVTEVLRIEKQFVVTEEIHITQYETEEVVRQTVPLSREEVTIERLDASGQVLSTDSEPNQPSSYRREVSST